MQERTRLTSGKKWNTGRFFHKKTLPLLYGPLRARYAQRPAGYTRMYDLPPRKHDHVPMTVVEFINGPKDTLLNLEKYKTELAEHQQANSDLLDKDLSDLMQRMPMPSERNGHPLKKGERVDQRANAKRLIEAGRVKSKYVMELFARKKMGESIPEEHPEELRWVK